MNLNTKQHNTENTLIKLINADVNAPNNEQTQQSFSVIVVIPHDVTPIVIEGGIKTMNNTTSLHYTISVHQNRPKKDTTKLSQILYHFIKTILLGLADKVKQYLLTDTFADYFKNGVKTILFIKRLLNWWEYVLYVFGRVNFDWQGNEYIANIFNIFL